jgi:hypothetical protein
VETPLLPPELAWGDAAGWTNPSTAQVDVRRRSSEDRARIGRAQVDRLGLARDLLVGRAQVRRACDRRRCDDHGEHCGEGGDAGHGNLLVLGVRSLCGARSDTAQTHR